MTMQVSEKAGRGAKNRTKPNCKTKMQSSKDQGSPAEANVKVKTQVKSELDQLDDMPLDSRQFNGHHHPSVQTDIAPNDKDEALMSHKQNKDAMFGSPSALRPPTRGLTSAAGPRTMVSGPSSQADGPPPNYHSSVGPRISMMPMGDVGAGMPMGCGQMQVAAGGHFIQNQCPVFVFSTMMANLAAEAFESGQFESIIHFHRCHPDTQQFLQKYPLSSHPGMNIRHDGSLRQPGIGEGIPESSSALANVAQWVQQQNANLQQLSSHSPNMNFGHHPSDGQGFHPNGRYGRLQQWSPSSSSHMIPPNMGGPQGYQVFGPQPGFAGEMNMCQGNAMHDPMSKDSLTSQQLQKREQSLANLRKIKEMLLPELLSNVDSAGPVGSMSVMGRHGNPDGAMPADGWPPPLMHPNVGLQRPGRTVSPDTVVGVNFMPCMGPGRPSFVGQGGIPPNWDMAEQQREWWRLEQDVCMEKHQRQYAQMGMNMPPGGVGPNHSHMGFVHPMQQMHRTSGPMSPSFPGNSAPSPHCGPMVGNPQSTMFNRQADFGLMISDQNFSNSGGLPHEGVFPYGDNQTPSSRFGSTGEPFSPTDFSHPADQMGVVKMPPLYGPQKRKRSANALSDDDVLKRLLPAPSPQTFSFANSAEGQELTITKQRNQAFHDQPGVQPTSSSPPTYQPPPQKPRPSGGKKKKSQPKNTDQKSKLRRTPPAADSLTCPSPSVSSPAAVTTSASSLSALAASSVSQMPPSSLVNISNSDVILNRASSAESSSIAAPTLPTGPAKSSMNITSPSLANLAKGIDNLSAQIQQNPFRTVQMQENESDVGDVSPADSVSLLPSGAGRGQMLQNPAHGGVLGATGIPLHSTPGCSASVQPMIPANPSASLPGSSMRSALHSVAPRQGGAGSRGAVDLTAVASYSLPSTRVFSGEGPEGAARFDFPAGGGGMSVNQPTFAGMGSSPGTMSSHSGCHPANNGSLVTGNAKIQIQAQAPNTIQYLPSNPSSGGQAADGIVDGFVEFNPNKLCAKSSLPSFGNMMDTGVHNAMMSTDVPQRPQIRMRPNFDSMHGPRGPVFGPRGGALSRTGVPLHLGSGIMQDLGSPVHGPGNIMQGMGNPMHHPTSPIMGPSGPMHDQTGPMMEAGSVVGSGGHLMNDMMPVHGHLKPGMMSNSAEFGPMMMDPGARGCEMAPDGVPMMSQRRPTHPDAIMVPRGCPEFGMSHREPMLRTMQGCNVMGQEMGMMPAGGREPMVLMQRPELTADRTRSNRSRQKARTNETEADVGTGMTGSDPSGSQVSGSNQGMMSLGMGRMEMGMMGQRPDMMSTMSSVGPGGDCVGMMIARGNGMSSDVAMMGSLGVAGGRAGAMDGPGISPGSIAMHSFGPSRRIMPLDMDVCQPPMMQSEMSTSGMCPPGLRPLVMQSPAVGKSPGPGMAGDTGFGVQYQPFQQTMYSLSQSPTVMMRGGKAPGGHPDVMVRSPYDIMGSGPNLTSGSGMGFGQVQPGLGPPGTL